MQSTGEGDTIGVSSEFIQRWRLLGRPWFLGFVFVLALNDHLLKDLHPGWWTGKLSDVAGVAIVGTVTSVFLGRRVGLTLTGIGFLILKTLPGVAESADLFLGGVTSRDASDLVALAILIPLARLLGPHFGVVDGATASPGAHSAQLTKGHRYRAVLVDTMPVAGAVLALVTTTATSCGPGPAVTRVVADRGFFYAYIDRGWSDSGWALSGDGGRTWQPSGSPTGYTARPDGRRDPYKDPGPAGPTKVCAADGTCWRLRDRRVIERRSSGEVWIEEFRLSDDEFSAISTGCTGGQVGVLGSIALTERPAEPQVLASLGAHGVLTRQMDGRWERNGVLSAPPMEARPLEGAISRLVLLFGPVLFVVVWLIGRRRWPSWRAGLVAVVLGWVSLIWVSALISVWAGGATDPQMLIGRAGIVGMVVTSVVAVSIARRAPRTGRIEGSTLRVPRRPDIE